ncbi:ATP-dependent DNA helicase DinG [Dokdonella sp.]|uniref:ATP-dependent DNA helicase DinG n=1 Tax=Dokdonella sp. TaxID=2291710 RepID=UPI0031BEA32E|nr:ATP-dependent DNA helicase DinG [Dokdonella sp.]
MTDEATASVAGPAEGTPRVLDEALKERIREAWRNLQANLPGFAVRREQNRMVAAVSRALATRGGIGVIEAPTGVGKSLAYLVAGVPAALASGKVLVISTGTVALQAQLVGRDIPAFLAATGIEASVAIAKGRTRYLCPRNLAELEGEAVQDSLLPDDGLGPRPLPAVELERARQLGKAFAEGAWAGDLDSAPVPVSPTLRARITTPASACPGRQCAFAGRCPVLAARTEVREAQIVVTNHALLLASLALGDLEGGQPIIAPPGDMLLVVDEAHHLAGVAIDQGAAQVVLRDAAGRLARSQSLVGATYAGTGKERIGSLLSLEVSELFERIGRQLKALHTAIRQDWVPEAGARDPVWRAPGGQLPLAWKEAVDTLGEDTGLLLRWLAAARLLVGRGAQDDPARERLQRSLGMAHDLVAAQAALWEGWRREDPPGRPPMARWVSLQDDGDCSCHCSPVSAADVLRTLLWKDIEAVVLTSATLTGGSGFEALAIAIGLPEHAETLALGSPFDLPSLAELVVPRFPATPDDREGHPRAVADWLVRELDWQQGSLVLFTSRWKMEAVFTLLPPRLRVRALVQGEGNKAELIAEHLRRIANGDGSVLFGLNSFGEGLDLPGAACTTVVITQVPFAVPTDPQTATLSEWIESRGHSAFNLVAIPHALRMLTQFAGRLVRGPHDRGRVVILDSRLLTRRYGRRILEALPPFRRVLG